MNWNWIGKYSRIPSHIKPNRKAGSQPLAYGATTLSSSRRSQRRTARSGANVPQAGNGKEGGVSHEVELRLHPALSSAKRTKLLSRRTIQGAQALTERERRYWCNVERVAVVSSEPQVSPGARVHNPSLPAAEKQQPFRVMATTLSAPPPAASRGNTCSIAHLRPV